MVTARWEQRLGAAGIVLAVSSYVLLFLFMAYPMVLKLLYVKAFLFAIVILAVIFEYLTKGRSRIDFSVSLWTIGLALLSFFFVIESRDPKFNHDEAMRFLRTLEPVDVCDVEL